MKKALISLLLALTIAISTNVAVFAVDDPGAVAIKKSPKITDTAGIKVKPPTIIILRVDDPGC